MGCVCQHSSHSLWMVPVHEKKWEVWGRDGFCQGKNPEGNERCTCRSHKVTVFRNFSEVCLLTRCRPLSHPFFSLGSVSSSGSKGLHLMGLWGALQP